MSEIDTSAPERIWGFYEEEYPIYTNEADLHPELSSPMTVDEANGLVRRIKELTAERDEAQADFRLLQTMVIEESGVKADTATEAVRRLRARAEKAELDRNALTKAIKRVQRIRADMDNFDGDRRGHMAALDDAEEAAVRLANAALRNKGGDDA